MVFLKGRGEKMAKTELERVDKKEEVREVAQETEVQMAPETEMGQVAGMVEKEEEKTALVLVEKSTTSRCRNS